MLKQSLIVQAISLVLFSAPLALATQPVTPTTTAPATPPATQPVSPPTATASTAPPTAAKADPDYHVGSVVTVYQLQQQGRKVYQQGQAIGQFVNKDNPWNLGLHKQDKNLAFFQGEPLGYEADGYFVAKQAGEYSFAAEVDFPPADLFTNPDKLKGKQSGWMDCRYRLIVADESVIDIEASTRGRGTSKKERACGLAQHGFGTVQLEAGFHKFRQWFACSGERKLKVGTQYVYPKGCPQVGKRIATDTFPADEARVTLRVRHPQENAPVLLKTAELVHEKR